MQLNSPEPVPAPKVIFPSRESVFRLRSNSTPRRQAHSSHKNKNAARVERECPYAVFENARMRSWPLPSNLLQP
jgi:hypothetical protein